MERFYTYSFLFFYIDGKDLILDVGVKTIPDKKMIFITLF